MADYARVLVHLHAPLHVQAGWDGAAVQRGIHHHEGEHPLREQQPAQQRMGQHYQRQGTDGQLRPLHLDRAAAVLHYAPLAARACAPRAVTAHEGYTAAELFACGYFSVERLDVRTAAALHCGGDSFRHLLCVAGEGAVVHGGVRYPLRQGDSYFLPAALGDCAVEGACRVLLSRV